ncbi:MAG: tetratricopeptide repeat protein [Ginsengibacter sp.]
MVNKQFHLATLSAITLLTYSCSNGEEDHPGKQVVSEERRLKTLMVQYPDSVLITENLIEYYRNNGSYDTAIIATREAIQKDSANVDLWDIMGTLQYENGDTMQAIKAYEIAIDIYPLPEYIISLGTLYAQTKNQKALEMADALIVGDRANAKREALFIKGLYYNYISDKKRAIAFFDSCISKDYTYMFAYREKAIALYDQAKYEEASKVLTRAVTIQNNFDEGYYWLGKCYEKLSNMQKAKESYQMALLYDKNFIEAKQALARLTKE